MMWDQYWNELLTASSDDFLRAVVDRIKRNIDRRAGAMLLAHLAHRKGLS